jgi:hypothetical protein
MFGAAVGRSRRTAADLTLEFENHFLADHRAMNAMMTVRKIDIAVIEAARARR